MPHHAFPHLHGPEMPAISGKSPKQLVVLLHGLGADGEDLISLAPMLAQHFPDAHFMAPNAPEPCDMAPYGYQWFSLREWTHEAMLLGAQRAYPILSHFLDDQLARFGLGEEKLALIGFSQGTMMALYTAPRREHACAGIVGYSGALLGVETLSDDILSRPPVCLIHGQADQVVPFDAMAHAESRLATVGIPVETHARPALGHGIDPEGIEIAIDFLKQQFA